MNAPPRSAPVGVLPSLVLGHRSKYLGLTTVLAWHYCLWFVPNSFASTFLLDDRITFAWLIALAAAAVVPLTIAWRLGRDRHLRVTPVLVWVVSLVGSASTLVLTSVGMTEPSPWLAYAAGFCVGACGGVLWVMWGERLARQKARFTLARVAPVYGGFLLVVVGAAYLAPAGVAQVIVTVLPLLSGVLLHTHLRTLPDEPSPRLLPAKAAVQGKQTMITVTVISFAAAFVCYYTVAITDRASTQAVAPDSFAFGIMIGAALILMFAAQQVLPRKRHSAFRVYPWLLLFAVMACVLFLADSRYNEAAFLLAVAVSSVFEILLTLYMGVLTQQGFTAPATAFAVSIGAIRLGICLGNGTALVFERVPGWDGALVRPTFIVLVAVLTALLMPMVRQEFAIEALTRSPQAASELADLVNTIAEEFRLSEREREIMSLIAQGYTASAIAQKLVISPYTVNTHIQHIYGKIGIHKRSELISYLHRSG